MQTHSRVQVPGGHENALPGQTGEAPRWVVYGALVLVQIFFGLNYLATKVVLEEIPPRAWALIRVSCSAILLLLVARLSGRSFPTDRSTLWRLALFSVVGIVVNQLFFVEGLSRTTATHASIIMTGIPVGTLLFAALLGRERMTLHKLLSLLIGFLGVLLIIRPTSAEVSDVRLLGDVLTLINAMSYSLFLVVSKRVMTRVDPVAATALLMAFGTVGMAIPSLTALPSVDPATLSPQTWLLGLFIVVFPTASAYLLINWALARADSSVVAFFIYLQPLIATVLAVALLGEKLTSNVVLGAALVFLAVYLVLRPRRLKRAAAS